jgi:hypothetical protein
MRKKRGQYDRNEMKERRLAKDTIIKQLRAFPERCTRCGGKVWHNDDTEAHCIACGEYFWIGQPKVYKMGFLGDD